MAVLVAASVWLCGVSELGALIVGCCLGVARYDERDGVDGHSSVVGGFWRARDGVGDGIEHCGVWWVCGGCGWVGLVESWGWGRL